jgi:hypothetical protein
MSCFIGILIGYIPNDFEMISVAPVITVINFVFYIPHVLYLYLRSLYSRNFSACFLFTFINNNIGIIIIIIIGKDTISFMQGIYTYIP